MIRVGLGFVFIVAVITVRYELYSLLFPGARYHFDPYNLGHFQDFFLIEMKALLIEILLLGLYFTYVYSSMIT